MNKYLIILGAFMLSAIFTPYVFDQTNISNDDKVRAIKHETKKVERQQPQQRQSFIKKASIKKKSSQRSSGKTTKITADRSGHFMVTARMNGRRSKVLVDTGATYVAINQSTAKKMGIRLKAKDFKYKVNTANGIAYAAAAVIDEIKIGKIRIKNVQATVSKDEALTTTLLGMSFLNRLDKFVIEGKTLTLKQ